MGREEMNGGWKLSQLRGLAGLCVKSKRIRKGREIDTVFVRARATEWGARARAVWRLHVGSAQAAAAASPAVASHPCGSQKACFPARYAPRPLGFNPYKKALLLLTTPAMGRVWARKPAAAGERKGVPMGSDVSSNNKRPLSALCLGGKRFQALSGGQSLPSRRRMLLPVSSSLTGALLFLFWEAKHQHSSPLSLSWENK